MGRGCRASSFLLSDRPVSGPADAVMNGNQLSSWCETNPRAKIICMSGYTDEEIPPARYSSKPFPDAPCACEAYKREPDTCKIPRDLTIVKYMLSTGRTARNPGPWRMCTERRHVPSPGLEADVCLCGSGVPYERIWTPGTGRRTWRAGAFRVQAALGPGDVERDGGVAATLSARLGIVRARPQSAGRRSASGQPIAVGAL